MKQNDQQPLVSCIMPTYNRRAFVPHAIKYFQRQDYKNKELIIIDDGSDPVNDLVPDVPGIRYIRLDRKITLGAKLNMACSHALGSILVNWDDDDWYAGWRLQYQVDSLQKNQTGVCGINKLLYYDLRKQAAFRYVYPPGQRPWLLGSSLCYTKQLWSNNRFADIDVGMDGLFVWNTSPGNVTVLDNYCFSVHMIHSNNVSPKQTDGIWWHPHPVEEIQNVMGTDWDLYTSHGYSGHAKVNGYDRSKKNGTLQTVSPGNIYACLVHENQDCIRDLIQNLRYNDPSSLILLYNGSTNADLIPGDLCLDDRGVIIYPHPVPTRHGYLHKFALDCMEYACGNFEFDYLTIVDSDQLSIRTGYVEYLRRFTDSASAGIGMLSSRPERVDRNNKTNHIALQAFREYEIWRPFLEKFDKGEDKFVHWTFWPSSVFMKSAAEDLVKLFNENKLLQDIMQRTKIWATEEVILPTMVSLLGYEIAHNPCSYDFVKYRMPVNADEVSVAMKRSDTFWIHPVSRNMDDPIRKLVRGKYDQYNAEPIKASAKERPLETTLSKKDNEGQATVLVNKIKKIEGWLSEGEASLLLDATEKACNSLPPPHTIVEVGSYHGKATILIGSFIKENFPGAKIVAIDPHDGKLGAEDQGLTTYPPSLEKFKENITNAGVGDVVEIVHDHCRNVEWNSPVSLLLIDGLHDYMNVSQDFNHFSNWIRPGGLVAFHDYADYYPGVKVFVDELLTAVKYSIIQQKESLIVLQKI